MAQSRAQQGRNPAGRPPRPWNVYYPREYTVRGEHSNGTETRTDFIRVGAAFRLREREGLSIEIQLPLSLPAGTRLVAMPQNDDQEGGDR